MAPKICPKCKKNWLDLYPLRKLCFYCWWEEEKVPSTTKEMIEVPYTEVASRHEKKQKHKREAHMGKERELLAKRLILEKEGHAILDQLDAVFFKIAQVNAEIEEQREKQVIE